jgi:hypothetical protein
MTNGIPPCLSGHDRIGSLIVFTCAHAILSHDQRRRAINHPALSHAVRIFGYFFGQTALAGGSYVDSMGFVPCRIKVLCTRRIIVFV